MKIVIDIPEKTLDAIKTGRIFLTKALYDAFENGTPLKDLECVDCMKECAEAEREAAEHDEPRNDNRSPE